MTCQDRIAILNIATAIQNGPNSVGMDFLTIIGFLSMYVETGEIPEIESK